MKIQDITNINIIRKLIILYSNIFLALINVFIMINPIKLIIQFVEPSFLLNYLLY